MSKTDITISTKEATRDILNIIHYNTPETNAYAIERLGAIIACADFERDLLRDIQKNKPEIDDLYPNNMRVNND